MAPPTLSRCIEKKLWSPLFQGSRLCCWSKDKLITSRYFCEMSENLEKLLIQVSAG